jgi:hypothetical protein
VLDLAGEWTVASLTERLGELDLSRPPTIMPVASRLARYPTLRFKLDATPGWSDELIAELQALGAVASIDFKGATAAPRSTTRPTPASTGGRPKRSRTPGWKTATSGPRRRAPPWPATRRASPGTRRSTTCRTPRRAGGAAHGEPQAVAVRLAALINPDGPKDIAPGGYDALDPEPGVPESPLDPGPAATGFRRA